eukprot:13230305-Alexandrium_andersonii.AAC.1
MCIRDSLVEAGAECLEGSGRVGEPEYSDVPGSPRLRPRRVCGGSNARGGASFGHGGVLPTSRRC